MNVKVFISWSGEMSRELGQALSDWLPAVLQSVRPFFTPNDIDKGKRWSGEIAGELDASVVGIFCLTKENLTRPWIMFEAGALSKNVATARVCPILFNVKDTELQGPLVQFQASVFTREDIEKLILMMNGLLENKLPEEVVKRSFGKWWPELESQVQGIIQRYADKPSQQVEERPERELIEEILELVRHTSRPEPQVTASSTQAKRVRNVGVIVTMLEKLAKVQTSSDGLFGPPLTSQEAGDAILDTALTLEFLMHEMSPPQTFVIRASEALAAIQGKHRLKNDPRFRTSDPE